MTLACGMNCTENSSKGKEFFSSLFGVPHICTLLTITDHTSIFSQLYYHKMKSLARKVPDNSLLVTFDCQPQVLWVVTDIA